MAKRPNRIIYLMAGRALGAMRHHGFAASWNWVLSWIYFFKCGPGLILDKAFHGHPELSLNLVGGNNISVRTAGKSLVIDYVENKAPGGGNNDGNSGDTLPGSSGGYDYGGQGFGIGGNGDTTGGTISGGSTDAPESGEITDGDLGTDCNGWSDVDIENDNADIGMINPGDSCEELNGW